jgi:hypothetical protein
MTFSIEARLNGSSASFDNFRKKKWQKIYFLSEKNEIIVVGTSLNGIFLANEMF